MAKSSHEMAKLLEKKASIAEAKGQVLQPSYLPHYDKTKQARIEKEGKRFFKDAKDQVLAAFNMDNSEGYEGLENYLKGYNELEMAAFFAVYGKHILYSALSAATTINRLEFLRSHVPHKILSFALSQGKFYVLVALLGENQYREKHHLITPDTNRLLLEKIKLLLTIDSNLLEKFMNANRDQDYMTEINVSLYREALKDYKEKQIQQIKL